MLRIVAFPMLFTFLFSMACMGQTFQYSRGWTNGKRGGAVTALDNLFDRDNQGWSELLDLTDANGRRLETCLLQLQRFIKNPLLLHSSAGAASAPNSRSMSTSQYDRGSSTSTSTRSGSGRVSPRNSKSSSNTDNNPYARSHHQSSDLFEELGAGNGAIIDTNDYAKQ